MSRNGKSSLPSLSSGSKLSIDADGSFIIDLGPMPSEPRILVNGRVEGRPRPLMIRVQDDKIYIDLGHNRSYRLTPQDLQILYSPEAVRSVNEYIISCVIDS